MSDTDFVYLFKQLQFWNPEVGIKCKYVLTRLERLTSTVRAVLQMQELLTSQFAADVIVAVSQTLNHRRQRNLPSKKSLGKSWIISIRHMCNSGNLKTRVREGGVDTGGKALI